MMRDWKGLKVVIVGAARQGIALARYLAQHGAKVILTDRRSMGEFRAEQQALANIPGAVYPVEWVCGNHPMELLDDCALLCLSGGVSPRIPLALEARKRGIPLSNDSQIFMEAVPCIVIGITGSAGKSTTTSLVGRIAESAFSSETVTETSHSARVWVGGNIGNPLISELDHISANDLVVMELSSFQLELMNCSPQIAAILNITPNHLDRHESMDEYREIKSRILKFQDPTDTAVLGRDDPVAWSLAQNVHDNLMSFGFSEPSIDLIGTYLKGEKLYLRLKDFKNDLFIMTRKEIRLRGDHNVQNVLAACAIAAAAGLPIEAMRTGISGFTGIPHRLEFVRSWGGADWYNDSIATTPERTIAAIKSFEEPLILLAGGRDKGLSWDALAKLVLQRVDHVIAFGEVAEMFLESLADASALAEMNEFEKPTIIKCESLEDAVAEASRLVEPGDVVLLSPGGTSFDEFKDFEERGKCFDRLVKDLI